MRASLGTVLAALIVTVLLAPSAASGGQGHAPGSWPSEGDGWWGGAEYALAGASCPSDELCVAAEGAGDVVTSTDPGASTPTWSSPVQIDGNGDLTGVSCPSSALCVAVDGSGDAVISTDPAGPAQSWSEPVKVDRHGLTGVSCPSVSLCVVVDSHGDFLVTTDPAAARPVWSAPSSIVQEGSGEDDRRGSLSGVSCPSTELCVAVASDGSVFISLDPGAQTPAWSSPAEIDPDGELTSVSCLPSGLCVAVDGAGNAVVTTDATSASPTWSAPVSIDPIAGLISVSCPSATLCVAVDGDGDAVYSANPTAGDPTWSAPVKVGPGDGETGVSCPTSTLCLTVDLEGGTIHGARLQTGPEAPTTPGGPEVHTTSTVPASPSVSVPSAGVSAVERAPAPVLGETVTVDVLTGPVEIHVVGTTGFRPLTGERTIPMGSEVDATDGRLLVTVATLTPGKTQTAEVYGGRFRITQERGGVGEAHFTLTLPLTGCPRLKLPRGSAASIARHHRRRRRAGPKSRHLWVSEGGGDWGTNGRYVSTAVEGTDWITQDECVHSRVRVVAGRVEVRNLLTRRTTVLAAGQSYVAVRH